MIDNEDNDYNLETLDRFEMVVNKLGLYLSENNKALCLAMREDNCDTLDVPIMAYASEECETNERGYLVALNGGNMYMAMETKYIDEKFYCNGSIPVWGCSDEYVIDHVANLMKEYKLELSKRRKMKAIADFVESEEEKKKENG